MCDLIYFLNLFWADAQNFSGSYVTYVNMFIKIAWTM